MAVNLINFLVEDTPLDQVKAVKIDDSTYGLPLNFKAKYPPFSARTFLDHPNQHIKMQNGGYFEREKVYRNKGNTNVDSSNKDGFIDVRKKELAENAIHSPIRVDPTSTKEIIEDNLKSKNFNKYPMDKDEKRYPKPMSHWREDKSINLVLEDVYQSTNTNRGRGEHSFNQEIIIGKIISKINKEKYRGRVEVFHCE
jgi:hypothetical protein